MDRYDLDHVALAAADTSPALAFLTGQCGGTVLFGGQGVGFRPMQVWIGDAAGVGMSVELLEPWATERNDFLARFVARHVAGPHHLTFKVPDIRAALDRVRGAGYTPVNVDLSDPEWMEAFLMPREAQGTVVQLAETTHTETRVEQLAFVAEHGVDGNPRWWQDPSPAIGAPLQLHRVVLRVPQLTAAVSFFAGLLQGDVEDEGDGWAAFVWPRGGRILAEERTGAPAGVDRLEVVGLEREHEVIGTRFVPSPAR